MFKYLLIAFALLTVEAAAGQPYYYGYWYYNGYTYQYQWVRGYRRDPVEKEHARLDYLERQHDLELRKSEMRSRGVLPQLPAPVPHDPDKPYEFAGHKYRTLEELKGTPAWKRLVADGKARERAYYEQKEMQMYKNQRLVAKYHNVSSVDAARMESNRRAAEALTRPR